MASLTRTPPLYIELTCTTISDPLIIKTTANQGPSHQSPLSSSRYANPLQSHSAQDHNDGPRASSERTDTNATFQKERNIFLNLAQLNRSSKSILRHSAITKIQAVLRGILTRRGRLSWLLVHNARRRIRRRLRCSLTALTSWNLSRAVVLNSYVMGSDDDAKPCKYDTPISRRVDKHCSQTAFSANVIQTFFRSCVPSACMFPFLAAELIQTVYRRHRASIQVLVRQSSLEFVAASVIQRAVRRCHQHQRSCI